MSSKKVKGKSEELIKLSVFIRYATLEIGFSFAFCLFTFYFKTP